VLYGLAGPLVLFLLWRQVVRFWRAFPSASALGVAGAVTLAAGAAGLEVLGYAHLFTGHVEVALEETLEMIGGTLMLCAAVAVKDAALGSGMPPGGR
jgi:succinylarginine dihydrolase